VGIEKDEKIVRAKILELMDFYPLELLGAGGSGQVYKCKRESYGIEHFSAVKVLLISKDRKKSSDINKAYTEGFIRRGLMEIEAVLKIGAAPNILALEDYKCEELDEKRIIILIRMELAKPFSISEALKISKIERMKLILELGTALVECEKEGIIHGDIKPENIFIGKDNRIKLGDFGIAGFLMEEAHLGGEESKGTPGYCTPEFWRKSFKHKSMDQYSLGILAYRLFNEGNLAFVDNIGGNRAESENQAFRRRMNGEKLPFPKQGGRSLGLLLEKAISHLPQNRYESSLEFCQVLEKLIREEEGLSLEEGVSSHRVYEISNKETKVKKAVKGENYVDWIGNLWNGDFICYHEGRLLISDVVNGGLYAILESRELRLLDRGCYFALKSFKERLYGLDVNGCLVEIRFLAEWMVEIINSANNPISNIGQHKLKGLRYMENGIGGITLNGESVRLKIEENIKKEGTYGAYIISKEQKKKQIEIEALLATGKKCFRPIPYKNVLFHGGVHGATGVFFGETLSGNSIRLLGEDVRTLNRWGNRLITANQEGVVKFYDLDKFMDKDALKPEQTIEGQDIEHICCVAGGIFMQSTAGRLFMYEKGVSVQLYKLS